MKVISRRRRFFAEPRKSGECRGSVQRSDDDYDDDGDDDDLNADLSMQNDEVHFLME